MRSLAILFTFTFLLLSIFPLIQGNENDIEKKIDIRIAGHPSILLPQTTSFIHNQGQLDHSDIQFYTQGQFRAGFCSDSIIYAIEDEGLYSFKVNFEGCNPTTPVGQQQLLTKHNYFLGEDSGRWRSNVPLFGEILYPEIYDGIDLLYYFKDGNLKYDFIVQPGADPNQICLTYEGVDGLEIGSDGNLVIHTPVGEIYDSNLLGFQNGQVVPIEFKITDFIVSFNPGNYDINEVLVIDPELVFSTYFGVHSHIHEFICNDNNTIFGAGTTQSSTFPITTGAYDTTFNGGSSDMIVSSFAPNGEALLFSTFVGGSFSDHGRDLVLDSDGNIYVTGSCYTTGFPTTAGAYDTTSNGWQDGVFFSLNHNGSVLRFSSYIGTESFENCTGIELDSNGDIYICGDTSSPNFPATAGAYDETHNGMADGFLCKFSKDGSSLLEATYIGGTKEDFFSDMELDTNDNIFVVGDARSNDFPMEGSSNDTVNSGGFADAVLCKVGPDLDTVEFSTYIGGSHMEYAAEVSLAENGNIVVAGETRSTDFYMAPKANDTTYSGENDNFIAVLSSDGSDMLNSTYFGGSDFDYLTGLNINHKGEILIFGYTKSSNIQVSPDAMNGTYGGDTDGYYCLFSSDLKGLNYSSYWGGDKVDNIFGGAFDSYGNFIFGGKGASTNFYRKNALNSIRDHAHLFYVAKIRFNPEPPNFAPTITNVQTGDGFVNLTILPPSEFGGTPITHYSIYRSLTPGDKSKYIDTVDNKTWFNDTGLTNGLTYYYNISAVNAIGEGPLSTEVSGTPLTVPSVPLNPMTSSGPNYVNVSWDVPSADGGAPIGGYNIYRGTTSGALSLIQSSVSEIWYNDTGRTNGVTYYYSIGAFNIIGQSVLTSEVNDTPYDKPSAPFFLTADRGDGMLNLSWNAPTSFGGDTQLTYDVYRGDTNLTMTEVASDLDVLYSVVHQFLHS